MSAIQVGTTLARGAGRAVPPTVAALYNMYLNRQFRLPAGCFSVPRCHLRNIEFSVVEDQEGEEWPFVNSAICPQCGVLAQVRCSDRLCFSCARDRYTVGIKEGTKVVVGMPRPGVKTRTVGSRLYGYGFPIRPMVVTQASAGAEQSAALNRQCAHTPPPDEHLWSKVLLAHSAMTQQGQYSILYGTIPRYSDHRQGLSADGTPLTRTNWNQHFPAARRAEHELAWQQDWNTVLDEADARKWCSLSLMVKIEKLDKCDTAYAPRFISCFRPRVTAFTGPPITAAQNWLHQAWDGGTLPILFAAGCNYTQLSAFFDRYVNLGWNVHEDDFSNYDSTQCEFADQLAIQLLKAIGFEDELLFWKLRLTQTKALSGKGPHGVFIVTPQSMKSGQADTCVTNTIINVVVHLAALCLVNTWIKDGALDFEHALSQCSMMVMGDDILLFTAPGVAVQGIAREIEQLGLISKFFTRENPDDAVFLNLIPYRLSQTECRFAPKVGRLLARLGWSVAQQNDLLSYNCAIGKGFLASCAHVPVLRAYCSRLARLGARQVAGVNHDRGLEQQRHFQRKHLGYFLSLAQERDRPGVATAATYTYMLQRYGWSRELCADLEAKIAAWPDPPALVGNAYLENAIEVDC